MGLRLKYVNESYLKSFLPTGLIPDLSLSLSTLTADQVMRTVSIACT